MKSLMMFIILVLFYASGTLLSQDLGTRDTLRFDPVETNWIVDSPADSLFSVELWAYTDQDIRGMMLPFVVKTSTGGGTGHDDSLVVIDTVELTVTGDVPPLLEVSVLDSSLIPGAEDWGFNGLLIGLISYTPLLPQDTCTKIGDLRLKLVQPSVASQTFDVLIDTTWVPPGTSLKFSPPIGSPSYIPVYLSSTISVVNHLAIVNEDLCGDVNGSGGIDIDDIVYLIAYVFQGGPEPTPPESGEVNCAGGIDIDDIVYLIAYVFQGGYAPGDPNGDGVPDC